MSDDNFEALDNASLRKKCLEHGLPNVPITDTSRKILIRKLRATIAGEIAEKKKTRRETIHVTKIPSPVEPAVVVENEAPKGPTNKINRRTIAATSVTSTVDDNTLPILTKTAAITDRRRSVRSQAEQEATVNVPVSIPLSQKRKPAVLIEDDYEDDDDDDDVILLQAAENSEQQTNEVIIPRARRSVSLTKTGVVTTSYNIETVVAPPTVHETESESDTDFVAKYASSYEPVKRTLPPPQPVQDTTYGLTQRKTTVEPERTSSYRTTTVNRTSIEPDTVYKPSTTQSRYSSLGSGYTANTVSSVTTSTNRRFTSGGYGSSGIDHTYNSIYNEEEDDDGEGETPYLSDFARKLERLKAEPLVKGVESPRNIPIKRETQRFQSSIVGRRSTVQKDSVADSFKNFLFALDRKYNLKRNFAILFALILILFIYVVFIQ